MVDRNDIEVAAARIGGHIRHTPSYEVRPGLWFKLELLQHSGSFKARGAFNRILAAIETRTLPEAGVVVASGGNAGLGVAFAATRLGVRAEVFVPLTAPKNKVQKLRRYGAQVHQHGSEYADALAASAERVRQTGALVVHAYDQPEVVAGQGTLGLELPDVDTVIVSVGGGGLAGGLAAAVGDRMHILAVEPKGAPTLRAALDAGHPVDVPIDSVAGDSLGARRVGELGFALAVQHQVRSVLVDDDAIVDARQRLWHEHRLAVEHGAAAAFAAVEKAEGSAVVILCGANTDPYQLNNE